VRKEEEPFESIMLQRH